MKLTNNVKEIREKQNLTQEQLAQEVEVSRQTIIAIEKGNYDPSLMLAMRISKHFKLNVEDVFVLK